jgi:hypothetical protein
MGQSYMEMIYIDTDGNARKTGCGAAMDSNSETLAPDFCNPPIAVFPDERHDGIRNLFGIYSQFISNLLVKNA